MSRKYSMIFAVTIAVASLIALAGCAPKTQDTKGPVQNQTGIIDMGKAIKSHPQYGQLERLQQELSSLSQQLEQQAATSSQAATPSGLSASSASGISQALEQEFNARMADKQAELNKRIEAKAAEVNKELSAQMQAYAEEIDKVYQPQIFSLQLKLKTVQLSKDEMAALQKELETLQGERAAKLTAKEQELSAQMRERMNPEQAAVEKEMAAYAQTLNAELAKRAEAASAPAMNTTPATAVPGNDLEKAAIAKQQEISSLQEKIIKDIQEKTAKVAMERGLTEVVTNIRLNISAMDITDAVVAEFKK